jgi:hypothetical protein
MATYLLDQEVSVSFHLSHGYGYTPSKTRLVLLLDFSQDRKRAAFPNGSKIQATLDL